MKRTYDVLVVGGGPGGAIAARTAAEKGLSACLIEKRPAIGVPVRCAEGIGKDTLKDFTEPNDRWISAEIDGARFVAPDGTTMDVEQKMAGSKVGYILDRKVFDRDLVWQAAEAGADVFVKTRAVSALMDDGRVKGAAVTFCGEHRKIGADVVIAADGIESKFTRWCGLDTTVPMRELMSCAQYVLADIDIDPRVTVFYFGNRIAPEGYLWVFPKGERTANVGIGISGRKSKEGHRARQLLDRFIADTYPHGKKVELIVGGVSVCRPLPCTAADGLMVVGDAARLADPMTGGGIANAMITGRLAAEVAADAIGRGDVTRDALMAYDRAWRQSPMGKSLEKNYRIKEIFITLDDAKLNTLIQSASRLDLKDFSIITLVKELMKRNPKLILELKSLYSILK